jgi:hypothetical protein
MQRRIDGALQEFRHLGADLLKPKDLLHFTRQFRASEKMNDPAKKGSQTILNKPSITMVNGWVNWNSFTMEQVMIIPAFTFSYLTINLIE